MVFCTTSIRIAIRKSDFVGYLRIGHLRIGIVGICSCEYPISVMGYRTIAKRTFENRTMKLVILLVQKFLQAFVVNTLKIAPTVQANFHMSTRMQHYLACSVHANATWTKFQYRTFNNIFRNCFFWFVVFGVG